MTILQSGDTLSFFRQKVKKLFYQADFIDCSSGLNVFFI